MKPTLLPVLLALVLGAATADPVSTPGYTVALPGGVPLAFKLVPAGSYDRGSPDTETDRDHDEGPVHRVTLSRPFYLGVFEVTQAQWRAITGKNPAVFNQGDDAPRRPVTSVSWNDCADFIARLNALGLGRFRLPTEAEWEYAARAGTTTRFPWGDDPSGNAIHGHAWANSRSYGTTQPVGTKPANPWGFHDLHGNAWEWRADGYGPYRDGPQTDPAGPATGTDRVFRGGSWFDFFPAHRSANRHRHPPDRTSTAVGLRLVLDPESVRADKTVLLPGAVPLHFMRLDAGSYLRGSPESEVGRAKDEGPAHRVTLGRPFYLGKFEITQAQWSAVMGNNPSTFTDRPDAAVHPVDHVSWTDAREFFAKLNLMGFGRFRLPTESEWEYAARAGTTTRFPWGDDPGFRELPAHGWFNPRSEGRSHPVGLKRANAWGIYDLAGGVWEWCADWKGDYPAGPVTDPAGPAEGKLRVIRGGSWFNEPEALRSANRHGHEPASRQTNLGLRIVWEPPAPAVAGRVPAGYRVAADTVNADAAPWSVPVPGHVAPAPGEHPRLLFRRADLPALRAKAATPEGRAILQRLRTLLDGAEGTTLPAPYTPASASAPAGGKPPAPPPGTYTFSHVVGYGLLYQLTGEPRYAELGRQAFARSLAGERDRDGRYSFRQPGGALRAGPVLGWMAVGYDLCYDGWDAATRETFGRALFDYREVSGESPEKTTAVDLAALTRGTMPPYSNHFSMQIGGASLVLLALGGEPWIDRPRVDALLRVAGHSMVRNLAEGFGDGGFFAEGDGTGSMASQIVFLGAVQAWRNAAGRDFVNGPRPHTRMLSLKWIYQTVFREGRPDFWPIRGGYGHNVWARAGQSGAAYFAAGLGAVNADDRAAMLWCYDRFLATADAARGEPHDTASVYPHFAVSAFVNWPVGLAPRDPAEVLPLVYRDTVSGFYCWRDRWRDGDDTVITVLTDEVRGFMGAKAETALSLNTRGQHLAWGRVTPGVPRHWSASPRGETSALTFADGTAFAVDFSGASGAGVMLVTTGPATGRTVRLGATALTFFFPTTDTPPALRMEGDTIVVGRQRITLANGNLTLAESGR